MNARLQRLALVYRREGAAALAAQVTRRALATVYASRCELLILKRLDAGAAGRFPGSALRLESITPLHASLLRRFNATYRTRDKIGASAAYIARGYRGYLAFRGDLPIGYWWWVDNEIGPALTHPSLARFDLALHDDEVFAFDYFIAPAFRDEGAAVRFLARIYGALAALGYGGVWGSVDADNLQARWVYRALGNRVVRRVVGCEVLSSLVFQDGRVFVRNSPWNPTHPFDHRLLWPRPARPSTRTVPSGLSTHGV